MKALMIVAIVAMMATLPSGATMAQSSSPGFLSPEDIAVGDAGGSREPTTASRGVQVAPVEVGDGGGPDYDTIVFDSIVDVVDPGLVSPCSDVAAVGPVAIDLGVDGQAIGCTAVAGDGGPAPVGIDVDAVYDATPWPATEVMLSPHHWGVVNMETWSWHDPDAATEISASVQTVDVFSGEPITLTVTAELVGWCHHFDDVERPRFTPAAKGCGLGEWSSIEGADDEFEHAASHTYDEMGFYTTTVEQRWVGEATLVGPAPQTWALGPVTLAHQREYQVNEIISVLR